ncbi:hypothetical protein ABIC83_002440 [Roseateles asaccharophilus]|uniref:hypothetical protein n=1 Tax=Roseateles asaccharophilus TaxID=582607 RepID=UPI0038336AF1
MTAETLALQPSALRSSAADVRNPLLKLEASALIGSLPAEDRRQLRVVLDAIRREARAVGDLLWDRNRRRSAGYWRAASVYVGHIARLAHDRSTPAVYLKDIAVPKGVNPLLQLRTVKGLDMLSPDASMALESLLLELRSASRSDSTKSWFSSKSPMAVYWNDVYTYAGHIARYLRRRRAAVATKAPVLH